MRILHGRSYNVHTIISMRLKLKHASYNIFYGCILRMFWQSHSLNVLSLISSEAKVRARILHHNLWMHFEAVLGVILKTYMH